MKVQLLSGRNLHFSTQCAGKGFPCRQPNEKWLTDITEFVLLAGKACLSPIVDCFDGMVPCWMIGKSPDAAMVNSMLDQAISIQEKGYRPLIHSNRGCHYRWPGWISWIEQAELERFMSKKGCSPDNSAYEGLFGCLKNEIFYNKDWIGVSIQIFIDILNEYLICYNKKRIKISLGNMGPMEYRQNLGLSA